MKLIHARSALLVWLAAAAPALSQSPFPGFPPQLLARESAIPLPGIYAIGDLDADGDADLLANAIGVNDGNARFTAATILGLYSFYPNRTIIADLDGDGLGDVVSTGWASTSPRIDLNAGGFNFVPPTTGLPAVTPLASSTSISNIAVADVDADGDLDVMLGVFIGVSGFPALPPNLWLNDGAAGFTPAPAGSLPPNSVGADVLIMQDVDANGYPDAVFGGFSSLGPNVTCMKNTNGVFTIAPSNQWSVTPMLDLEVGDFNGDGRPDLAAATVGGTAINFNSATGFAGFLAPSGPIGSIRAIDVNVDGTDELLVSNNDLSLRSVLPNGSVGPALQTWPGKYLGVPNTSGQESIRDLDGDGDRDVIVNGSGYLSLLMNTATGSLVSIAASDVGASIWMPLVGDVNGDGHPDVLGFPGAAITPLIVIALNDGEGALGPAPSVPITLPGPAGIYLLHAFDRDGDGDCDLYAARGIYTTGSGALADVLFDNTGGSFSPIANVTGTGDTCSIQSGDLDGDGDADLLLGRRVATTIGPLGGNGVAGPMLMLRNLGAAGFAAPVAIGTNHATYDLDLGDFDGDGSLDVFQTNALYPQPAGDPCVVYLNNGAGTFNAQTQNFTGYYAVAGDLNGDGRSDVIVDGTVHFSLGGAAFSNGPSLASPLGAPPLLSDVDGDSDLDLIESDLKLMLNLGAGIFSSPYYSPPPVPPIDVAPSSAAVDLDHDGDPDFITTTTVVYTNYQRHLVRGSVPRPGRPASLDLYGAQNSGYLLYASNGTAQLPFAPYGTVLIDPASAVLAASGTLVLSSFQGTASLSGTLPPNPALIGWTTYWQAVDVTNLKTTNRVTMTVLNY